MSAAGGADAEPSAPGLASMMVERGHRLRSAHLGNERTVWVLEPTERLAPPRAVVVVLDAEFYRDRMDAVAAITALHGAREIAPARVVFLSMESVAARWVECPCHPPFARFMAEEFWPWLEALHPGSVAAPMRVIVGLSYTGLAAAYVALRVPGLFTKVIAQSGSFWWRDCWLAGAVARLAAEPKAEWYLEVGSRETQTRLQHREDVFQEVSQIEGVTRFAAALRQHGYRVNYHEFAGGHEFVAWAAALPEALRWALPTDAAADGASERVGHPAPGAAE